MKSLYRLSAFSTLIVLFAPVGQNVMHYFLRSWKGLFLAVVLINSITFVGPTANASSIKLKGDTEIVYGDDPYQYLQLLRIGAGQEDPP